MAFRQFEYLDDLAVRSLLASENIAIPEAITEVSESTTEGEGGAELSAGFEIPYVGKAEGGANLAGSKMGRQMFETSKRINDQYIFNVLHEEVEDEIVDITEGDTVSCSEGDLVKISGAINTDAIYRILTIFNAYSEVMDIENQDQIQEAHKILYSDAIGLSLEVEDSRFAYGMRIDPDNLWTERRQAFLEAKEYVVFGRVSKQIGGEDRWDYLNVAELIDSILVDETMDSLRNWASGMINAIDSAEGDMEVPDVSSADIEAFADLGDIGEVTTDARFSLDVEDREIALEGPGFVIHPIAIYW
ncbi:hypothetical protein ACFQDG_15815 [Natronoarchaeum mannanilyticum]|uniref:Uncharacterized protein n=1 Tax=Natronoarchaeum mannanilyticum TaxID=926360 RepID=A0AAV3T6E1_9EURY